MQQALKRKIAALQAKVTELEADKGDDDNSATDTIPRPKGSNWSKQIEMGLAGSFEKHQQYLGILVESRLCAPLD